MAAEINQEITNQRVKSYGKYLDKTKDSLEQTSGVRINEQTNTGTVITPAKPAISANKGNSAGGSGSTSSSAGNTVINDDHSDKSSTVNVTTINNSTDRPDVYDPNKRNI